MHTHNNGRIEGNNYRSRSESKILHTIIKLAGQAKGELIGSIVILQVLGQVDEFLEIDSFKINSIENSGYLFLIKGFSCIHALLPIIS